MSLPRIVNTTITDDVFDTPILLLGRVGENLATRVVIDATDWQATGGDYELIVKRADSEMFTATITVQNDVITWTIPAAEIGAAGYGEVELNYLTDGIKAKTARCDTRVFTSVEIDSLPPSGTTWSQLVLAAVGDAQAAQEAAEAAQTAAQTAQAAAEAAQSAAAQSASAAAGSASSAAGSATAANNAKEAALTAQSAAEAARNAAQSAQSAAAQAASAAASSASSAAQALLLIQQEVANMLDPLKNATIRNTTETASFDNEGRVISVVHKDNATNETVRTDMITYNGEMVTEVRTLPNGNTQTNIYDLRNLVFKFNV